MVLCAERSEKQLKCAYRKYYIVCIITIFRSGFCADIARKASATQFLYKDMSLQVVEEAMA